MRILLLLAACACALLVLVWLGQRRLMYFPFGDVPPPAAVGLPHAEEVSFTTEDDLELRGWFVPAATLPPRATLLVFNGNAGNRAYRAPLARAFAKQDVAVLLFDYRGYGDSAGAPHERGLALDARAARRYLLTRPDIDPARLVYFGESLGSAVATALAAEHPPAALVLRSPFTSMTDVAAHHYPLFPVRLLLRDRYAAIDQIPQVRAPLLVIAGNADRIVPFAQSRRLFEAATEPKSFVVIEGADHNDEVLTSGPEVVRPTVRLIESLTYP